MKFLYRKGSKGKVVKVIQEWLCLHGDHIPIDGDFGPATQRAVINFQIKNQIPVNGMINDATRDALVSPMMKANGKVWWGGQDWSLGEYVVTYAKKHLVQGAREVGGQNKGPWVRLYMRGNEGPEWPWCAGFACYVLRQAARAMGVNMPLISSYSCDHIAFDAQRRGILLQEGRSVEAVVNGGRLKGSLFLVRRNETDWIHVGIVTAAYKDCFETIEGNSDDEGRREGHEVCQRFRGYRGKDFVLF